MTEKQKAILTEKQQAIFDKIIELKDRLEDYRCEMTLLYVACEGLAKERDGAIQRAEKAEREVERLGEIVTECDGVECVKHDSLVRIAIERAGKAERELAEQKEWAKTGRLHKMKKITKLRDALKLYGNPDNWRFTHDKDGSLLWITSLGPDYAIEILNGIEEESSKEKKKEAAHAPGDGTLIIKK